MSDPREVIEHLQPLTDPLADQASLLAWLCTHGVNIVTSFSIRHIPEEGRTERAAVRFACENIDVPQLLAGLRELRQDAEDAATPRWSRE